MKRLDDVSVLITGATSGIGKATAVKLAHEGATILAVSHTKESALSLEKEIVLINGTSRIFVADLARDTDIQKLYTNVSKDFPSINWIVYAAGVINEHEPDGARENGVVVKTFAVNVFGAMGVVNRFTPIMTQGIILISSTAGIRGNSRFPIYAASKGALNTYAKSLSQDFETRTLSCITICPGPTNTSMRRRIANDADTHQSPNVVASLIYEIVSGESKYKNGDNIVVRDETHTLHERL